VEEWEGGSSLSVGGIGRDGDLKRYGPFSLVKPHYAFPTICSHLVTGKSTSESRQGPVWYHLHNRQWCSSRISVRMPISQDHPHREATSCHRRGLSTSSQHSLNIINQHRQHFKMNIGLPLSAIGVVERSSPYIVEAFFLVFLVGCFVFSGSFPHGTWFVPISTVLTTRSTATWPV
jgi:hypothetical protein